MAVDERAGDENPALTTSDLDLAGLDEPAIVAALGQVLASASFKSAPKCRDLLAFVVTETLAGRGHLLNERVVARLALGRPPSVDTRTDAGARVQARRTRELLERYYADEGRDAPLRLTIPIGQYAAAFSLHRQRPEPAFDRPAPVEPVVTVVGFRRGPGALERRVAAGLSESIVEALSRFPGLRVVGPVANGPNAAAEPDTMTVSARTGADYVLHGGVRAGADVVRVSVHVADGTRGEVRWAQTFENSTEAFNGFAAEDEILGHVVGAVGDTGGFVLRELVRPRDDEGSSVIHRALSQYYAFLDELTPSSAIDVVVGLQEALDLDPHNAHVIASLGFVFAVDVLMRGAAAEESMAVAEDLGRRALSVDPASATASNILGIVALARGHLPSALRHAEQVLATTPYHPGNTYVAGMLIGASGQWDRGIEIIRRAVRVNPYGPNHRHTLLAVDALMREDVAGALAEASLLHFPGYIYGPLLQAICLAELGLVDDARGHLDDVLAISPDFLDHPVEVLATAPTIPQHAAEHLAARLGSWAAPTAAV